MIVFGNAHIFPAISSTQLTKPPRPALLRFSYDTGVILDVTPRVNSGGLVTMDVSQEVTDVGPTTSSGIDAPTFQQRKITSTVAVQSGNTIVLGGLIRDRISTGESGVPFLHRIPVVGGLFGSTSRDARRTELLVLITPRAVRSSTEAREVTEELASKMSRLRGNEERAGEQ